MKYLFSLLMVFFLANVHAQHAKYIDPLKKPDLWHQLEITPTDSTLWVEYMGKQWNEMSFAELNYVHDMKQIIMLKILHREIDLGIQIDNTLSPEHFFIDEFAFLEFVEIFNYSQAEVAPANPAPEPEKKDTKKKKRKRKKRKNDTN